MNKREVIRIAFLGGMPDKVPWTIYRGLLPQYKDTENRSRQNESQALGIAAIS